MCGGQKAGEQFCQQNQKEANIYSHKLPRQIKGFKTMDLLSKKAGKKLDFWKSITSLAKNFFHHYWLNRTLKLSKSLYLNFHH